MKRYFAIALAALLATGCKITFTGEATTSAKVKAGAGAGATVHTGAPVEDPAHPIVEAKPIETGTTATTSFTAEVHIALPVTTLGGGVKEAKKVCPNTEEVTNGVDDDCDGQIDENEVGSGPLQVTLWWSSPADLDLKVVPPGAKQIDYKNKKGAGGGYMDKDSRSSCKGDQTIENVYWAEKPPKGAYTIKVKYYSECKDKTKPKTTAFVTVAYQGQILGPYEMDMDFGQEVDILQFQLDE